MRTKAVILGLLMSAGPLLYGQDQAKSQILTAQEQASSPLINQLHQREWVRIGADGKVHGRVVVIESSERLAGRIDNKVILSREGKVIYETKTGTDGVFEIKGVSPGAYALQTVGDYTFAAFAIHILPASAGHLTSSLDVYASNIGVKARQLLASSIVPADLEVGQDVYYRSHSLDPIAKNRKFSKNHQVILQDGHLVGRVSRPGWAFSEQDLSGSVVRVMMSGEVVAQAKVDKAGFYKVEKLEPGIYDLLVAGGDGFAAFQFEAVDATKAKDAVADSKLNSGRFVATQAESNGSYTSNCLSCELISPPEISCYEPAPIVTEVVADCGRAPLTGGGSCGGGGFGGGGGGFGGGGVGGGGAGGGMGGFAGLAGIAGLAVGIAALSDDDDAASPIAP